MALTALQRKLCRLVAGNRTDLDLFHDTDQAVAASWDADRHLFQREGFQGFFPLVRHDELGLVLHAFDLATNKVLALVGRLEVRDWIDVIHCAERLQPLGYLAWAASGKDPGFSPEAILEHAARSSHYSAEEVAELAFAGAPPDAADLSRRWHVLLDAGREVVDVLPAEEAGKCVLTHLGELFQGDAEDAKRSLAKGEILFHAGRIKGAFPRVIESRGPPPGE